MVCNKKIRNVELAKNCRFSSNNSAISKPYITKAMLFPISMFIIKRDSSFVKIDMILEVKLLDFLSNSNFNLLDETKAISMPEKNAENNSVRIIKTKYIYCGKIKKKSSKQTIIALIDIDTSSYISNLIA